MVPAKGFQRLFFGDAIHLAEVSQRSLHRSNPGRLVPLAHQQKDNRGHYRGCHEARSSSGSQMTMVVPVAPEVAHRISPE